MELVGVDMDKKVPASKDEVYCHIYKGLPLDHTQASWFLYRKSRTPQFFSQLLPCKVPSLVVEQSVLEAVFHQLNIGTSVLSLWTCFLQTAQYRFFLHITFLS
jgi:hypothetical protein